MNKKTAIALLIIAIIMSSSTALTAQAETVYPPFINHLDTTQQLALSTPLVIGISSRSHNPLDQPTRAEIYLYVQNNPGVHFRGICEALTLCVGMVQYHISILACAGFLSIYGDGKMQRFFVAGKYSKRQMKIISLLRHETSGKILRIINVKKAVSHGELAAELQITSQGLTWQIHHLEKEGVVEQTSNGLKLSYNIKEAYSPIVSAYVSRVGQT